MFHTLDLSDLTVSYARVPALHHVTLRLHAGRSVALVGPNGAGKTTFLKAVAGLVPRETGNIYFYDRNDQPVKAAVAYLPQREIVDWQFPITVRGLIEMGRYPSLGLWNSFTPRDEEIVDQALHFLHLEALADRQINALSGGQQQRTFLARAWAQEAEVYLLDEPLNGLDRNAQQEVTQAFRALTKSGRLVIASHHDLKSVPQIFDDVVLLNGELVAHGPVAEAFTPEVIEQAYATEIMTEHRHG
jgi:manganese/iron transport system ATP-binding protein/manganese/zinc/iron transport system ATP- binding protein